MDSQDADWTICGLVNLLKRFTEKMTGSKCDFLKFAVSRLTVCKSSFCDLTNRELICWRIVLSYLYGTVAIFIYNQVATTIQ